MEKTQSEPLSDAGSQNKKNEEACECLICYYDEEKGKNAFTPKHLLHKS
jgi:hypothetical protein